MSELLSQQEIDSLLSGIGTTTLNAGTVAPAPREIIRFDFRLPHRLSKQQLQTFHGVHDSFAESFSSYLVGRLQTTVTMSVVSVSQMFYSEYIRSTAKPSSLFVFQLNNSDAMAVMELSPQLVLGIIARLLGGTNEGNVQSRSITRLEQNIIRGVVLRALTDLEHAWAMIAASKFKLERYETDGDLLQIAPGSEIVLVISFELAIGEQKHLMNLCFPTFALEDVLAKLSVQMSGVTTKKQGNGEWSETILKNIEATTVPASCVLAETSLTLRQLVELEPGDVLMTNTPITGELRVIVGGKDRAKGRPGISSGRKAVRITHIIEPEKTHG
jgi:flagellar motor switch protein FliM